jgi:hypothetical protein
MWKRYLIFELPCIWHFYYRIWKLSWLHSNVSHSHHICSFWHTKKSFNIKFLCIFMICLHTKFYTYLNASPATNISRKSKYRFRHAAMLLSDILKKNNKRKRFIFFKDLSSHRTSESPLYARTSGGWTAVSSIDMAYPSAGTKVTRSSAHNQT